MHTFFKYFIALTVLLFLVKSSYSQDNPPAGYFNDAIQFSQTNIGGSARYLGLGGATIALGADVGSVNSNPAGLGLFKKSEFSFSPAFNFAGSNSTYLGSSRKDNRQNFNIGNIGIVLAGPVDDLVGGAWRGGAFGVTLTRINNFQNQYSFSGKNPNNSMADYFAQGTSASGVTEQQLQSDTEDNYYSLSDLSYKTYLINPSNNPNMSFRPTIDNPHTRQSGTIDNRGAQYQWDIGYGGNINDKVFLGASLGIPTIRYISNKTYKEIIDSTTFNEYHLQYSNFTDYLKVSGLGINFKIGLLFKPIDQFRFGFTLQSPTLYSVKTEYQYGLRAKFDGTVPADSTYSYFVSDESAKTVTQYFNYNLTAPARFKAGAAWFFGKHGFISGQIELVPYKSAQLSLKRKEITDDTDIDFFVGDNQYIRKNLKTAMNLNIGGEYRIDIYRLRAGAALIQDPYTNSVVAGGLNRNILNLSLGGGIRLPDFYIDVAFVNSRFNTMYSPYTLNNGQEPVARVKTVNTNFVITVGSFF